MEWGESYNEKVYDNNHNVDYLPVVDFGRPPLCLPPSWSYCSTVDMAISPLCHKRRRRSSQNWTVCTRTGPWTLSAWPAVFDCRRPSLSGHRCRTLGCTGCVPDVRLRSSRCSSILVASTKPPWPFRFCPWRSTIWAIPGSENRSKNMAK